MLKTVQIECSSCSPNFELGTPRLHSRAACNRLESTKVAKIPPIHEVVWQQPPETSINQQSLNNIYNDSTIQCTEETQLTNVSSWTSPSKRIQPQNHVIATEKPPGNQTGNEPVPFFSCSNSCPTEIQESEEHKKTTFTGDTTNPPLTKTTPLIEERLVRDKQTNELYLPITSTVVLKRKQELLYVPLVFENNLKLDALVDSGAYVSAIAQNELVTKKQKAPSSILQIDSPPNFQKQLTNGQIEKPLATVTPKFQIGNNIFAEHFVVMRKLTGQNIGLNFMRNKSVVIVTTEGLIDFTHLAMQVKIASSETTAKLQPVLADDDQTILPRTTKTITAFVNQSSERSTTGTVTPLEKFTETASLLLSHSIATKIDKRVAVRLTNTMEVPYLIRKITQIAEFFVVTSEQSKYIKPVDIAILSMIPHGDPDLTAYPHEFLRKNKPEAQKNTFWFPIPENPGKPEDHTPI